MQSIRRRELALAVVLAAIAGYLDAVGFLHLGGFFVSFMSGNTTRAAANAASGDWVQAGRAAGLIGLFFFGVVAGSVLSRFAHGRVVVLWATTGIVGCSAVAQSLGVGVPAILVISVAMGVLNATFQRGGEVSIGLTYMTGTLVKAGQRLVDGFFGGSRTAWLRYLAMWIALCAGAIAGAYAYTRIADAVLWIAVGGLLLAASVTTVVRRRSVLAATDAE